MLTPVPRVWPASVRYARLPTYTQLLLVNMDNLHSLRTPVQETILDQNRVTYSSTTPCQVLYIFKNGFFAWIDSFWSIFNM
jgi:hypothetical protein